MGFYRLLTAKFFYTKYKYVSQDYEPYKIKICESNIFFFLNKYWLNFFIILLNLKNTIINFLFCGSFGSWFFLGKQTTQMFKSHLPKCYVSFVILSKTQLRTYRIYFPKYMQFSDTKLFNIFSVLNRVRQKIFAPLIKFYHTNYIIIIIINNN